MNGRATPPRHGDGASRQGSTIGCVIPACDEEHSIARVIEALLGQTRVPDAIHVVVSNTADDTVGVAARFAGPHRITTVLGEQYTEVFVHDIGRTFGGEVRALNYGYALVEAFDYLVGVGGDTVADADAVERLEAEAYARDRSGGACAIQRGRRLSIFSTQALRDQMTLHRRSTPWVADGVEDPLRPPRTGTAARPGQSAGSLPGGGAQPSSDVSR
ncbi:glycosyltransferase [Microbacterium thalassium]|uniref:glycosyltransferase n=1 Tax=Microbacterium TaxID=33882 RepID=UPI002948BD4F|nr:glycosyltransferase [Microbacterium thalassium]